MEEVQSWWEVPNITYFCSRFRQAFNLLEFDVEELEEALVLDGIEGGNCLLQQLTISFLQGCYQTKKVTSFTWEQYLRDILQKKWVEEEGQSHPFPDSFSSFCLLSLRTKVEILHALCNYRLDCIDVNEAMKGLDADSLRIQSLGQDEYGNVYWYFYGTRLYKEEAVMDSLCLNDWDREWQKEKRKVQKIKKKKRGRPRKYVRGTSDGENEESEEDQKVNLENSPPKSRWSVVCTTEKEWQEFVEKFRTSKLPCERQLYRSLTKDFLPVLKQLFLQKERNIRKRLLEMVPRRTSARIEKMKQLKDEEERTAAVLEADEEQKRIKEEEKRRLEEIEKKKEMENAERKQRAEDRHKTMDERETRSRCREQKVYFNAQEFEFNKQDSSVTEESKDIDISSADYDEEIFSGMQNVLDAVKSHKSAWPFLQPVNESYAPGYFSIIKEPVDLSTIEQKIQRKDYKNEMDMIHDFKKMVKNCECYNGVDSKYTAMAYSLTRRFRKAMKKYCFMDVFEDGDLNQNANMLTSYVNGPEEYCINGQEENEITVDFSSEFKELSHDRSDEKPKRKKKRKRPPGMKAIEALAQAAEQALRDAAGNKNFEDISCPVKNNSPDHVSSAFPGLKITTIQNHPASLLAKYFQNAPLSAQDTNSNEATSSPFSFSLTSDSNQDSEQLTDCHKLRRSSTDSVMSSEENGITDCVTDDSVDVNLTSNLPITNVTGDELKNVKMSSDESHQNPEDNEGAVEVDVRGQDSKQMTESEMLSNSTHYFVCEKNGSTDNTNESSFDVSSTSNLSFLNDINGEKLECLQSLSNAEPHERPGNSEKDVVMDISEQGGNIISCPAVSTGGQEDSTSVSGSGNANDQQTVIPLPIQSSLDGSSLNKINQMVNNLNKADNILNIAAVQPTSSVPVLAKSNSSPPAKNASSAGTKNMDKNNVPMLMQQQLLIGAEQSEKSVQGTASHVVHQVDYSQAQVSDATKHSSGSDQNINPAPSQQTLMQQKLVSNSSLHQEHNAISANRNAYMNVTQLSDATIPVKKRAYAMETPLVNYQNFIQPVTIPCTQGLAHNSNSLPLSTGPKTFINQNLPSTQVVNLRPDKQWNSQLPHKYNEPTPLPSKNNFLPSPYTSSIPSFTRQSVIITGPPTDGQNFQNSETLGNGMHSLVQYSSRATNSTSSGDHFATRSVQGNHSLQSKDMGIQNYKMLNTKSNKKTTGINVNHVQTSHGMQQKSIQYSSNSMFPSQPYYIPTDVPRTVHSTQKSSIIPNPVTTFTENNYISAPEQNFSNKPSVTVNPLLVSSNNYPQAPNQSVGQPPSLVKPQQTQVVQKQPFTYENSDVLPVKNHILDSQYPPVFRELAPKFPVNYSRPQFVQYPSQYVQNDHQSGQYFCQTQRISSESNPSSNFVSPHVLPGSNYHSNSMYVAGDTSGVEMFNLADPHSRKENYCDKYAYLKSMHHSSLK